LINRYLKLSTSQDSSHIPFVSLLNINTGKAIISIPYDITSRSEKNVNAGKSGLSRMREKRKRMQLKSQANGSAQVISCQW
jgi:hypothetical protein